MERYIGLDVHATSTTAAMVDGRGKRLGSSVLETNGRVLVEFVRGQSGRAHVILEEGTQSGWLHGVLSPHAAEVVVTRVKRSRGQKSDSRTQTPTHPRTQTPVGSPGPVLLRRIERFKSVAGESRATIEWWMVPCGTVSRARAIQRSMFERSGATSRRGGARWRQCVRRRL